MFLICFHFPALFNNVRTLKFKAQPTNVFCVTVNQMFGGSSQLPTTAERRVEHSSDKEKTVLGRIRKPGESAELLIDGSEKRICRLSFEL